MLVRGVDDLPTPRTAPDGWPVPSEHHGGVVNHVRPAGTNVDRAGYAAGATCSASRMVRLRT